MERFFALLALCAAQALRTVTVTFIMVIATLTMPVWMPITWPTWLMDSTIARSRGSVTMSLMNLPSILR